MDAQYASAARRPAYVTAALLFLATTAFAQQLRRPDNKTLDWFAYSGDHAIQGRWGLHFDGGYRLRDERPWRQWLVRPGINYRLNARLQLGVAYAHFRTYPLGWGQCVPALEHRLHQQLTLSQRAGLLNLRHRWRLEERFLGDAFRPTGQRLWRWEYRPRYMLRTEAPLWRHNERTRLFLGFYDEILLRFPAGATLLEQNRAYAGLGWRTAAGAAIELGLINQRFQPAGGGLRENNFILVLTLSHNAALRQLFRRTPRE